MSEWNRMVVNDNDNIIMQLKMQFLFIFILECNKKKVMLDFKRDAAVPEKQFIFY